MKAMTPLERYDDAAAYPAFSGKSRREVLRTLAASVGGAVAGALVAPGQGRAKRDRFHQIRLPLARRHHFGGCRLALDWLDLQTRNARLAAFLGDPKERLDLQQAVEQVLRGATCGDVTEHKRLSALRERLGRALAARYRARTQRVAPPPIVTLTLVKDRPPIPGGIRPPSPPVPRP